MLLLTIIRSTLSLNYSVVVDFLLTRWGAKDISAPERRCLGCSSLLQVVENENLLEDMIDWHLIYGFPYAEVLHLVCTSRRRRARDAATTACEIDDVARRNRVLIIRVIRFKHSIKNLSLPCCKYGVCIWQLVLVHVQLNSTTSIAILPVFVFSLTDTTTTTSLVH